MINLLKFGMVIMGSSSDHKNAKRKYVKYCFYKTKTNGLV